MRTDIFLRFYGCQYHPEFGNLVHLGTVGRLQCEHWCRHMRVRAHTHARTHMHELGTNTARSIMHISLASAPHSDRCTVIGWIDDCTDSRRMGVWRRHSTVRLGQWIDEALNAWVRQDEARTRCCRRSVRVITICQQHDRDGIVGQHHPPASAFGGYDRTVQDRTTVRDRTVRNFIPPYRIPLCRIAPCGFANVHDHTDDTRLINHSRLNNLILLISIFPCSTRLNPLLFSFHQADNTTCW